MQDRFQFRVWKGKENRMVYGVTYLNPLLLDSTIDPENEHNILMQCTGLKDKNDKLIYELDYIKYKDSQYKVEINKFFSISLINILSGDMINMNEDILLNCEVISNEFERNAKI